MTTVEDHILFPHRPNWDTPPQTTREWETNISTALPGGEARQGMRVLPRRSLTVSFLPRTLEERARFALRIDAAKKSALACLPYFGRGTALAQELVAGANLLTWNDPVGWPWLAGDYAVLLGADDTRFDVVQVSALDVGNILHLDILPENTWPIGTMFWPLFFGKFSIDDLDLLSSHHEVPAITVTQTEAERNASVGNVAAPSNGIGGWKIGSTFVVS
jgi:hypothetical protein